MQKICKKCCSHFEITSSDLDFYKKISPKFPSPQPSPLRGEGVKMITFEIPTPTLCPDCRQQRRLAFRNERNLNKRDCDATGKNIISIYSPDKKLKVYNSDFWWSDNWNALDYGIDFDFNKSFFEQFGELMKDVPLLALHMTNSDTSSYCNYVGDMKDSYMSFGSWNCEKLFYSSKTFDSFNLTDSLEAINCNNSYGLFSCENCTNSYFLQNCFDCEYCISSNNLRNKKYYIKNKKYSKKDYFEEKKKITHFDYLKNNIRENVNIIGCENSTGNNLKNCNNCFEVFNSKNINNGKYLENGADANDVYDGYGYGYKQELGYEFVDTGVNGFKQLFTIVCHESSNITYGYLIYNSSNLFGCVGLKNKSYCILNKQYTKEEYNKLVPKIIKKMIQDGEWGEFFPANLSPFGYNETVAQEYFPLEKKEIIKQNFNYSEYENPKLNVEKIIPADKLPENITEIPDDILNWAIKCEISGKPFRIIKQELEFYRKHNLPIPKKHPDIRHFERMKLRNPRK